MNLFKILSTIPVTGFRRLGGRRGLCSAVTPEGQSESFLYRHRYLLSGLVILNAGIGGYIFLENKKRATDVVEVQEKIPDVVEVQEKFPDVEDKTVVMDTKSESLPSASVVTASPNISVEEKIQICKWVLEEKRKIKTADPEEKKRIDEEKAILKQYIRSKEIPTF